MRTFLAALAAALIVVACGPEPIQRQPVSADDGVHATGRLGDRQVHVSFGEPEVLLGPCAARRRPDEDSLCIAAKTIDGDTFGLIVENPSALRGGERVPVDSDCPNDDCALVELRRGDARFEAEHGELVVTNAGERYAARFVLRVGTGTVTGAFDVAPRDTA